MLRTICESVIDTYPTTIHNYAAIIEKARPIIFDFDYPIFDTSYKKILETKIIKHFFIREIGLETPALWKFYLDMKMNEIMPYYNQLYESQLLKFNPFYDKDIWTTHNGTSTEERQDNGKDNTYRDKTNDVDTKINVTEEETENNNRTLDGTTNSTQSKTGSSDGTNDTKTTNYQDVTGENDHAYSDTPQGQLSLVKNYNYLTNYSYDTSESHTDGEGTNKNTVAESHTDTIDTDGTTKDTEKIENEKNRAQDTTNTLLSTENENIGNQYEKNVVANNMNEYIEHVAGKTGNQSYAYLLKEFRDTFLNIDMEIINELNSLFMGIY